MNEQALEESNWFAVIHWLYMNDPEHATRFTAWHENKKLRAGHYAR